MKTTILTFIFTFFLFQSVRSQGDLQFNQVITIINTINQNPFNSPVYTVPNGKVWKIVKITANSVSNGSGWRINGILAPLSALSNGSDSGVFWLKSGDTLSFTVSCPNSGLCITSYFASIIEFNIVQ